jgi:hypothetical protein
VIKYYKENVKKKKKKRGERTFPLGQDGEPSAVLRKVLPYVDIG